MSAPHETPQFRNAAVYTVAVTFTVEGGARPQTACRRAERVAERLANTAARASGVVEVTAVAGPRGDGPGEILAPRPVRFTAANSGHAPYGEPAKLDRYLDPDHERALASLAEANARYRQRREADRERRRAIGCANTWRIDWKPPDACRCAYCHPDRHLDTVSQPGGLGFDSPRCLCGQPVTAAGGRCARHRDTALVVLDGDPPSLAQLTDHTTAQRLYGDGEDRDLGLGRS